MMKTVYLKKTGEGVLENQVSTYELLPTCFILFIVCSYLHILSSYRLEMKTSTNQSFSVCSPTVRIIAFQAIDPGSTPGRRILFDLYQNHFQLITSNNFSKLKSKPHPISRTSPVF